MTDHSAKPKISRNDDALPGGRSRRETSDPLAGGVGQALRSAFQRTTEEAVPDDLLDLLNRLN